MTRGDVTKLPKWAQQEIDRLERDVEHWKEKALVGPEGSDTFADPFSDGPSGPGKPLGKHARIRFVLGPNRSDHVDVWIRKGIDGSPHLEVNSSSGTLHVIPHSSNALKVRVGDWV